MTINNNNSLRSVNYAVSGALSTITKTKNLAENDNEIKQFSIKKTNKIAF